MRGFRISSERVLNSEKKDKPEREREREREREIVEIIRKKYLSL